MSQNRGVVLALHDATAIYRWLEFVVDGRKFWSPIEAFEAERAMEEAMKRLGGKLIAQFAARQT